MRIQTALALVGALSIAACSGGGGSGSLTPPPVSGASQSSTLPSNASALYQVTVLPTFGGVLGSAATINARGWIMGSADPSGDVVSNAALWMNGQAKNLGTLGGPNSAIAWPNLNNFGVISGISETAGMNPYNEPFSCTGFFLPVIQPTGHICVGFRWSNNKMTPLPTLGGPDGYGAGNNNWGQIVGWAENTTHDPTCTNGQVFQFEPVVWNFVNHAQQLPTLPGDPDGAATAINDLGQIVGISGICDQAVGRFTALHAVIWNHGTVTKLFNGSYSWNTPQAINERGEITGFINEPGAGDQSGAFQPIAFIWTSSRGLVTIPPLAGDAFSEGSAINDEGDVVGVSIGANFATARAFIYHNGKTVDLNGLVPNGTPELLSANGIDDFGTIVGQAATSSGAFGPAFAAHLPLGCNLTTVVAAAAKTSASRKPMVLSMQLRAQILHRFGIR